MKTPTIILLIALLLFNFNEIKAQRPVENKIEFKKTEPVQSNYGDKVKTYGFMYIVQPQEKDKEAFEMAFGFKEDIRNSINLSNLEMVEANSEADADLIFSVMIGQISQRALGFKPVGDKVVYQCEISMPILINWIFKNQPDANMEVPFKEPFNEMGIYQYESDAYDAKTDVNILLKKAKLQGISEVIDQLKNYFNSVSADHKSKVVDMSMVIWTLNDKKADLSQVNAAFEKAKAGMQMIQETDILPNENARSVIDEAILQYDAIIENGLKKKDPLYRMYQNKLNLEILNGNLSDAINTRNQAEKELGSFFVMSMTPIDEIESLKRNYDLSGINYK